MESRVESKVENKNNQDEATVKAYRYHWHSGKFARDSEDLIEYFVPDYKLAFNKDGAIRVDKPRPEGMKMVRLELNKQVSQDSVELMWPELVEPVTLVELPKNLVEEVNKLVDEIKEITEKYPGANIPDFVQKKFPVFFERHYKDKTTKLLFEIPEKSKLVKLSDNSSAIVDVNLLDDFAKYYQYKSVGNKLIKDALIQYISKGILPKDTSLNDLTELMKKLDEVEIQSLKFSVSAHPMIAKAEKERAKDNEEIERDSYPKVAGMVGGLGLGGGSISKDPLTTAGLALFGFVGSYAFSRASTAYEKYQTNNSWDAREKRANEVLQIINNVISDEQREEKNSKAKF
ncbi:MAG: hypothetical protein ACD_46C00125G0005 [uncultured bacterium]|nr:MAG: hypothetical protein ACD_46C00125G0005 [uncultured bacterium]